MNQNDGRGQTFEGSGGRKSAGKYQDHLTKEKAEEIKI